MHTNHHHAALSIALSLMISSGSCLAQSTGVDQSPLDPVRLSSAQVQSLQSGFAWFDRDAGIVGSIMTPSERFVEIPGLKERSGYLNVKVKTQTQMIQQIVSEEAMQAELDRLDLSSPASQTRGANSTNTHIASAQEAALAQSAFEQRITNAQQRIVEARRRLAPALREGYDDIDMHSVSIPAGISAEVAAEALMETGDYEYVSIDWLCYPTDTTPNDSLFGTQWHHAANRIDSVGAWDFTQGSSSTIIGVCDSGVDLNHPDLAAALVPGYNAVENLAQVDGGNVNDDFVGHGTLVAGSAAAIGNNGTGVSGVGWNFGIMPVRVANDASGTALLSEILEGARWASDNGAYAANCSFGGAEDAATRSTGGHIRLEGHLLVFAAGNDGLANQVNDWEKVTIVGASGQSDNWVNWSHTGVGIDCIAPGVNIRSTNRTGGYSYTTGTSFASPITAASMMLVHDANPALSADEVEMTLLNACDDKEAIGEDDQTGWGRINVGRAVEDAIYGPSITNLPFIETNPDATLSSQWRNPIGDVIVSTDGIDEPSAPYALNLDLSDSIETIAMRTAFLAGAPAEIRFSTQHRGVEAGKSLTVEYLDLTGSWAPLMTIDSDGTNQNTFDLHRIALPVLGVHNGFKLRFSVDGTQADDDWYIDDVVVEEFLGNLVPWADGFENGITLTLDWVVSSATATTDASNEPEGVMSAQLDAQDTMTSADIDVSQAASAVYIHFSTEHQGVEAGETLDVEYRTLLGTWNPLISLVSDGNDQTQFEFTQLSLPFDAYGLTTALRFTANGDESNDRWFVDEVAVTTEFIEDTCNADLTGDGILDFFDVSAFLAGFAAGDDYNNDGVTNFFDVSAFLSEFNAGCP
ncbi:MAG: S8 family serine peptidase [Phycisphaerales bacterium]